MKNPAVFKAIGGLIDEHERVTADGLIDLLLGQGFALQDISDTMFWVFEAEDTTFHRRVFSAWEQWQFPQDVQETLVMLADSGLFTAEQLEETIWQLLHDYDGPISVQQLLEAASQKTPDPFLRALLTPHLIRQ